MKIVIIAALKEELESFLRLKDKKIKLVTCGVGKVNAAAKTQEVIDQFSPDLVMMTGVAGAANPKLKIGDFIIADEVFQWDVDATAFGYEKGRILFTDMLFLKTNKKSNSLLLQAFNLTHFRDFKKHKPLVFKGRIGTGDTFIGNRKKVKAIFKEFKCQAIDMESGSVAQVCKINQIPFIVVKSISDKADSSAEIDFNKFVKLASFNSFQLIKNFLELL